MVKVNEISEGWSDKYKRSINCDNPKGFSQKAHCAGRKKNESLNEDVPPMAELVAMATVASVSVPVIKAMFKAAYKTGKGMLRLKRIANAAGVKLADNLIGEADQVRGSEPMPRKQKPSSGGSSPHPYRGRLVGEADEEQPQKPAPLAIDFELIKRKFSELESKGNITPEEADQMRRAIQSLATDRETIYPESILQFITVLLQK
jgi:hypothetical protein